MSTRYYTGNFRSGDIVIDDHTISITGSSDLDFTVAPGSKINFHLGNTTIEYGGTGATVPPTRNPKVLLVTPTGGGGDFNSVKAAVDSVSGATSTNTFAIHVAPGVYVEDTITMKPYVDILGEGLQLSTIRPTSATGPIFIGKANSCIKSLYLHGATAGTAVSATNLMSVYPFRVEDCYFGSNLKQVVLTNTIPAPSLLQVSGCYAGGLDNFTTGFEAVSTTGAGVSFLSIKGLTVADFVTPWFDTLVRGSGPGAQLVVDGMLTRITPTTGASTTCFSVENGAECRAIANTIRGYERGFHIIDGGLPPKLEASGNNLECTLYNIDVGHTGALGSFTGYSEITKTRIPFGAPFFLTYLDPRIITVSKKGGDYSSIAAAVASITDASESNRYVIQVAPGEYSEPLIDISNKPYVSINGSQIQSAKITPDLTGGDHHIFKIGQFNELSFLWTQGAPVGYAGIYALDTGDYSQAHKITIVDCDTGILVKSTNTDTVFYGEYIDVNGSMDTAYKCIVDTGDTGTAFMNLENCYVFPDDVGAKGIVVSGIGASADFMVGGLDYAGVSNTGTVGIEVIDGAVMSTNSVYINNFERAVSNPNSGTACDIKISSTNFTESSAYDIFIGHPSTKLAFQGSADSTKISNASSNTSWYFVDSVTGVFEITNRINMTFNNTDKTDLTTLLLEGGTMGLMEGGVLSASLTGTTLLVSSGYGYLDTGSANIVKRIDWDDRSLALPSYSSNYIYITPSNILSASATIPDSRTNIILGRVDTYDNYLLIEKTPVVAHHAGNLNETFNRVAIGSIFNTGSIVSDGGSRTLNVTSGNYFYGSVEFNPTGGTGIYFAELNRDSGITGGWFGNIVPVNVVNNTVYDDGSNTLVPLTTNYYTKHSLYLSGDGVNQTYFLVYGQAEYSTLLEAEGANIPTSPTYFTDSIVLIANIIVRQGNAEIIQIQDARPTLSFKASGVTASANHSNLLGLTNDDHTQYLLVNGNRSMAGALNMGGFAISGATTFNGINIQTHGSRHLPNGADPIATSVPSQVGTANATGTANFFARSDHVHAHGNQTSGTLHAISTTTVNGFMSAADKVILNNIAASQLVTLNATGALPNARVLGTNFFINNTHVSPTAAITESKLLLNFPTHSNANDPSADEKAALTGTFGAPSGSNRYVTELDPRVVTSTLIPTANVTTDMANLATVATQQESKGLPIYLHDTAPGGNVNVGTPLYYSSSSGTNPWNYLSWIGVGTTGVARAPFIAFTGAGCVFAAPMVLGLSFTLLNAGTSVNLNGGASVTTTWQIGDIFTDNATSQELNFGAGKYLVGRIEFSSNGAGKVITLSDRADVKITTLSLRGGSMYCGSNSTLDVDLCSGIASTIFIGANSSLTPQANCHVLVQSPANNTFQLYGGNCTLQTCNSSSVIVRSSATGARIIGNGNTITVATGATNVSIHGVNTVTDFGTNTLVINSSAGISTTSGVFSGSVTASSVNTDSLSSTGALTANTLNVNDLNVTGATSIFTLLTSGDSVFGGTGTFPNLSITGALITNEINISGNAGVNGDLSVTGATFFGGTLNVTGATSLGATTVRTNLGVTNNATVGGNILAIGTMSSASNTVSGNESIGGTLNVTGATSLGALTVRNDLGVIGNANITGTLSGTEGVFSGQLVAGSASVTGALIVGGVLNVSSNTNIGGALNVTGTSSVGVLTVRNTLGVAGAASITGTLSVGGTLNVTGATTTTTLTNSGNVTVGGNIVMTNVTGGTLLSNNVTGFRELILGQTGDEFGASRLLIRNRTGENGIIMEATNGDNIDLVDFILRNNVHQRNIRLESRGGSAKAGTPSFHIGGTAPDSPTVAFGDTFFNTNITTRMVLGGYLTDTSTKLHITDSAAGTSNLRFTNTNTGVASTDGLEIGYGSSAFINNREATGLSILTNNVERMNISATGSLIYVGPATFNSSVNIAGTSTFNGVSLNTLTATGASTLNSVVLNTLVATGATILNGATLNTLAVTGAGTFSTTLGVTGLTTLTGVNFATGAASTHLAGNGTQLTLRANAANTSGTVRVLGTAASSAFNNGAFVVDGGIGSGGAIFANTSLNTGNLSIAGSSITNNANGVDTQLVTLGTGRVAVSGDPTADLHISTKKYVDDSPKRITIYKSVQEQRLNTTAYTNDSDFSGIPLGVGTHLMNGLIFARANSANPDLRIQITLPAGTTIRGRMIKFGSGTTNTLFNTGTNVQAVTALSLTNTANFSDVLDFELIFVVTTAGNFDFAWGQNTPDNANASFIVPGSYMQFRQIV